jgi:hypothetical protein
MELRITGLLDFAHLPGLKKWNKTFRKLDLLPSSGEGKMTSTLWGSLERDNLRVCVIFPSPEDGSRSSFRNVVLFF